MASEDPGGPLSDAEFRELIRLLARYAERELDQWDCWKLQTSYGAVYLQMSRGLPSGWPDKADELFTTIWPIPAHVEQDQRRDGNQE
jgi:hypothetical protein